MSTRDFHSSCHSRLRNFPHISTLWCQMILSVVFHDSRLLSCHVKSTAYQCMNTFHLTSVSLNSAIRKWFKVQHQFLDASVFFSRTGCQKNLILFVVIFMVQIYMFQIIISIALVFDNLTTICRLINSFNLKFPDDSPHISSDW